MQNQSTPGSIFSIKMDGPLLKDLRAAATVAGIAAILSLGSSVMALIQYFVAGGSKTSNYEGFGGTNSVAADPGSDLTSQIFSLAISILLFFFLNRFATQTKSGIDQGNQQKITLGLGGLANYFLVLGILCILVIFGIVTLVIFLLAGE